MMKMLKKMEIEGNIFNLIKGTMGSSQLASYLMVRELMLFPKIQNKIMMSALVTPLKHCTKGSGEDF